MDKSLENLLLGIGLVVVLIIGAGVMASYMPAQASPATSKTVDASYTVTSQPRLSVDFINQVLSSYGSPASGKGQALYDLGQKYQISSDLALAFFGHESTFGTNGVARSSKSLGNLRCLGSDNADLNTWCQEGYAWFDTWEHGFESFYRLLRNLYVNDWHLTTLPSIIHKYAPAADHNDESSYVQTLITFLSTWYSGKVRPS